MMPLSAVGNNPIIIIEEVKEAQTMLQPLKLQRIKKSPPSSVILGVSSYH